MRQVSETGVTFRDPVNGSTHFLGPKEAMAVQNGLGADIIMAFDECPPYPVDLATATASLARTHRWLEACFAHHARPDTQALFPIVQGSTFLDLRAQSAAFVQQFQSVGVAIGGVSVGEPKAEIQAIVRETAPMLPENRPRYLMGVGTPEDLLWAIAAGIDMFDCVMPTRIARHGTFFTPTGRKIIKNSEFANDFSPLVPGCDCFTCVHHHRAYLRHLYRVGEGVAGTLLSIHNVRYLIRLAQTARQAVLAGTFADWHQAQTLASSPHGGQK
jgi:queuine tRNA-ribosyltransferase